MCTVTVVPAGETIRLACNRDQLRCRPAALPPRVQQFGPRRAVLPIDPIAGGSWIAVNDAGLALALLNVNAEDALTTIGPARRSRGQIIPQLLHAATPLSAAEVALHLDAAHYAPFRVVIVNRHEGLAVQSDGTRICRTDRIDPGKPLLFTSSGLGDQAVEGPRRQLFDEYLSRPGDWVELQDAFHRHRWADRSHLSVCMDRQDAQTVSHTVVSLGPDRVTLRYHPGAPDQLAEPITLALLLADGGNA